jgi:Secretion system C-terminal sorting domain
VDANTDYRLNSLNFSLMKKLFTLCSLVVSTPMWAQWTSVTSANTPICTYTGKQADPRMIEDKNGGSYIAWKDWRNKNIPDIFLQHLDKDGNVLWIKDGLNLCVDPADQSTPSLTLDQDGGVIVTWSDLRSGIERDIYAQRVSADGIIKWSFNGVPVSDKVDREHNEKIISDDANGAFIVWEELTSGVWDISVQHLDSTGARLWGNGGMKISANNSYKINGRMQIDKKGGAFVTWQQQGSNGEYEIYAQRLSGNGSTLWGANGKQITNITDAQINPKIDPDPSIGGIYISWIDKRGGTDYDIYAQRLDSNGTTQWGLNGKPVINAVTNQSAQDVISNNNVNGLVVVWKDKRNGNDDIFIQKLDKAGNKLWGANGKAISIAPFDQINPSITGDQDRGVLVTWEDRGLFGNANIRGQRVDSLGNMMWANNGILVSNANGDQTGPKNIPDGDNGMIVVFEDERIPTDRNIYAQRITANGVLIPLINNFPIDEVFRIYPNPFTNRIQIDVEKVASVALLNSIGQAVGIEIVKANNVITLTTNQLLPDGLYALQVMMQDGSQMVKSVLKVD